MLSQELLKMRINRFHDAAQISICSTCISRWIQKHVDVNVHPTKMELRFQNQQEVYKTVFEAIHRQLLEPELIPQVEVPEPLTSPVQEKKKTPSPDLKLVRRAIPSDSKEAAVSIATTPRNSAAQTVPEPVKEEPHNEDYFIRKMRERVMSYHNRNSSAEVKDQKKIFRPEEQKKRIQTSVREATTYKVNETPVVQKPEQLNLFEEKLLKREVRAEYRLIGQVFDTYWLVQFQDNLYIIDQHAAHERVLYERTLKEMKNREFTSQYLSPPIILTLSMQEAELLKTHKERFERIGFEIEPFGGEEYAIRAVPANLFSIAKKELFMEMLDNLADGLSTNMTPDIIDEKVASMSCKAAVKGNNRLSAQEVDALIGELLELENPYHCPHGRPTIIAMSKKELEKKFKRIV